MSCFDVIRHWCLYKDNKPNGWWCDRNNCYGSIFGILMFIGILAAVILFGISPLMYGLGLLTQLYFDHKVSDYTYWINIFAGMIGFILLFSMIFFLFVAIIMIIAAIYGIISGIIYCVDCWRDCVREYNEANEEGLNLI